MARPAGGTTLECAVRPVGLSLRYIEEREANTELLAALGGLDRLAASLVAVFIAQTARGTAAR
jgi:hypothetical protein